MKKIILPIIALVAITMSVSAQHAVIIYDKSGNRLNAYPSKDVGKVDFTDEYLGHDYVDLGLPSGIKWASMNIGANSPVDYGDYYAWGETETKKIYDWSTYKWCNGSYNTLTKYNNNSYYGTVDYKTTLDLEDDVAHVKWGGNWRMPTHTEIEELINNCTWISMYSDYYFVFKATSKTNGNSIILPGAGYRDDKGLSTSVGSCYYWSSSLYNHSWAAGKLYCIHDEDGRYISPSGEDRNFGCSVRPVYSDPSFISVAAIETDLEDATIYVRKTKQFTAAAKPDNATDKTLTWTSSDTNVATVSDNGLVTAKTVGTTTITVKSISNPSLSQSAIINVDYEYVDLGLSVKWATWNIGATAPEEYGDYYAWGETETKSTYYWNNYKWCDGTVEKMTKYCTKSSEGTVDEKTTLDPEDDVAHVKWGGNWRMPTSTEIEELINNCTWTWTTQNGVNGYKVTSNKNGNTIFLPAAGYRSMIDFYDASIWGLYWSSSLNLFQQYSAYHMELDNDAIQKKVWYRYDGLSVRPVLE